MKTLRLMSILLLVAAVSLTAVAQEEMTKEQWQQQITELTAKRNDLQNTLNALNAEIENLKKTDAEKAAALKNCQDELASMVGDEDDAFEAHLDKVDSRLNELSRLSNQDLYARSAELDSVQKWIDEAKKNRLSSIDEYANRLEDQQNRLNALKRTLEQLIASGQAMQTYTVGTWAKDRDCLWNIAKKPKIYDNAFLWPKIWQGNRDQIKNPDIIHPGQKLKIPPKAELTREERSAVRSYWNRKQQAAAPSN